MVPDCSPGECGRRLIEAGLPGRVAQHKFAFTEEHREARRQFARSTAAGPRRIASRHWSDEKKFMGYGFKRSGVGAAPSWPGAEPEYTVPHLPHPVKVHCWGCFCGRGLGHCYIYTEHMDAVLLRRVLNTHLIPSARFTSTWTTPSCGTSSTTTPTSTPDKSCKTWVHNHGVQKLNSPYSPTSTPWRTCGPISRAASRPATAAPWTTAVGYRPGM